MAIKNDYDIQVQNGRYLILPPWKEGQSGWGNRNRPNVHAAGGDSSQIYPVNTKFVDFDRRFIYGYQSGEFNTTTKANIGLFNSNVKEAITWGATAGVAEDTLVGILASSLDVETTAAANIFAGGYLMPRTNPYSDYRIVSNTAYNGGRVSGEMDIVIEEDGLVAAVAASVANCFLDKNPYTAMYKNWAGGRDYESVIGVTLIDPTDSTYQWVQVSGPVHVPGDEQMGSAANLRVAFWHIDGSIRAATGPLWSATQQQQYAGYCIGDTTSSPVMSWLLMMAPLD